MFLLTSGGDLILKKLYRSQDERMLGGVCGGIAEYFNIDPTLIRLAFVLFFFADGAGILAYIVGWIIIPEKPERRSYHGEDVNYTEDSYQSEYEFQEEFDSRKEENNETRKNEDDNEDYTFKLKADSQNMWGILLIIIGGAFLVRFWFPFGLIEKMWPLLIVFLGVAFLLKGNRK